MSGKLRVTFCIALLLVVAAPAFAQRTIHVPRDLPTIQAAIDEASIGDTVLVQSGTYTESLDFKGKHVILKSAKGAGETTLTSKGSIVQMGPLGVLSGFRITGSGRMAVQCSRSGSIIENCIFEGNKGRGATCIMGHSSSPIIRGNIFRHNGGTLDYGSCVMGFSNSSSPHVENNIFYNNGSFCINFQLPKDTQAVAVNNTIVGNGGGIYGGVYVANNIIANNKVAVGRHSNMPANWVFENNIVVGNNRREAKDRNNVVGIERGTLTADPRFVDPKNHDYRLKADSPAIDAGATTRMPAEDMAKAVRPAPRVIGDPLLPDIGAYEYHPEGYVPVAATAQPSGHSELVFIRARYGRGSHWADVLPKVLENADQVGLEMKVETRSFDADPVQGKPKQLVLEYRIGSRWYHQVYSEEHRVNIKAPNPRNLDALTAQYRDGLHIIEAYYGNAYQITDMTNWLREYTSDGQRKLLILPESVYADPAPGLRKVMTVAYIRNGKYCTVSGFDGQTISLDGVSRVGKAPPQATNQPTSIPPREVKPQHPAVQETPVIVPPIGVDSESAEPYPESEPYPAPTPAITNPPDMLETTQLASGPQSLLLWVAGGVVVLLLAVVGILFGFILLVDRKEKKQPTPATNVSQNV